MNYYRGPSDGLWGAETQQAIERFQEGRGLQPNGQLNPMTVAALRAGNVVFNGALNGASPLSVSSGSGQVSFNAPVGGSIPVGAVTVGSALNVGVNSTFAGQPVDLTGNIGADTFSVLATDATGPLDIVGGGLDTVNIGSTGGPGTMANIQGRRSSRC